MLVGGLLAATSMQSFGNLGSSMSPLYVTLKTSSLGDTLGSGLKVQLVRPSLGSLGVIGQFATI